MCLVIADLFVRNKLLCFFVVSCMRKKLVVVVPGDAVVKKPGCVFDESWCVVVTYSTHNLWIQHPSCYVSGTFSNTIVINERDEQSPTLVLTR